MFGRLVDLVVTFPFLVLVIAIVAVLGPGLVNMYIAIGVVGWVFYARLMRGRGAGACASTTMCRRPSVLGYGEPRILFRHILPNAIAADPRLLDDRHGARHPARLEPRLSRPRRAAARRPSGACSSPTARTSSRRRWWIAFFPGFAIVLCGIGFSLAGDGLADLLDVKR